MIKNIPVGDLKAAAYNPRVELTEGMQEYERLRTSIEEFGLVEPIVWNKRTGNVVGGHQRLSVMKELGMEEIPCSVVDLNETDEKTLNLALNKIRGRWDYDKLSDVLKDLDDPTLSGFSIDEIMLLTAQDIELEPVDIKFDWGEAGVSSRSGESWVVTLEFEDKEAARNWLEERGEGERVKNNNTTVIDMEGWEDD